MSLDKATADSLPITTPCDDCPHDLGDHSHKPPRKCMYCPCPAFALRDKGEAATGATNE